MERLAFYGNLDVLEGSTIEGRVILRFPSMEDARRCYDSPKYQEARKHRQTGAEYSVFIVEGIPTLPSASVKPRQAPCARLFTSPSRP